MRSSYPEAEGMKSLYNRIFKNNQVTYGRPYPIKLPVNIQPLVEEPATYEDLDPLETESPESILEKAREEAALIIKEAEYEAERILGEARAEAASNTRATLEEAWQKGYGEGNDAAREQYASIIAQAEEARDSALIEHDEVLAGMEAEIVGLVTAVAARVVGNELATNPDTVLYLVRQALDRCSNKNHLVLKVSGEDYEYIVASRDRLNALAPGTADMEIKRDPSLERGACLVDTPFGSVDSGAGTRLQKIEEAFREILEGR